MHLFQKKKTLHELKKKYFDKKIYLPSIYLFIDLHTNIYFYYHINIF
jgi:hypothetical protein